MPLVPLLGPADRGTAMSAYWDRYGQEIADRGDLLDRWESFWVAASGAITPSAAVWIRQTPPGLLDNHTILRGWVQTSRVNALPLSLTLMRPKLDDPAIDGGTQRDILEAIMGPAGRRPDIALTQFARTRLSNRTSAYRDQTLEIIRRASSPSDAAAMAAELGWEVEHAWPRAINVLDRQALSTRVQMILDYFIATPTAPAPDLLPLIRHPQDPNLRRAGVFTAGALNLRAAYVEAVRTRIGDSYEAVAVEASTVAGRWKDADAVPALKNMLINRGERVRAVAAAQALGSIGNRESCLALSEWLNEVKGADFETLADAEAAWAEQVLLIPPPGDTRAELRKIEAERRLLTLRAVRQSLVQLAGTDHKTVTAWRTFAAGYKQ
jgi:hypothetical protein